jgi:hypothetical protein
MSSPSPIWLSTRRWAGSEIYCRDGSCHRLRLSSGSPRTLVIGHESFLTLDVARSELGGFARCHSIDAAGCASRDMGRPTSGAVLVAGSTLGAEARISVLIRNHAQCRRFNHSGIERADLGERKTWLFRESQVLRDVNRRCYCNTQRQEKLGAVPIACSTANSPAPLIVAVNAGLALEGEHASTSSWVGAERQGGVRATLWLRSLRRETRCVVLGTRRGRMPLVLGRPPLPEESVSDHGVFALEL